MAFIGEHPLLTRAIATRNGARPKPATQCTPILRSSELPWLKSLVPTC